MSYIMWLPWLWAKAVGANPYGALIGMTAGTIIGAFLAQYLLARTLNVVWLVPAALIAAVLGGYIISVVGGFLPCWIVRILSRFS